MCCLLLCFATVWCVFFRLVFRLGNTMLVLVKFVACVRAVSVTVLTVRKVTAKLCGIVDIH